MSDIRAVYYMIAKQIDTNFTIPFGNISNISLVGIIQKKDLGSEV